MFINIDTSSGKPIYIQLKEQIKSGIASGRLEEEERLPPVRELALDLNINPNTVARAYRELKNEGFLDTARGRGTFASLPERELKQKGKEVLKALLEKVMVEAYQQGFNQKELQEIFLETLAKWENRLEEDTDE